MLMPFGGGEVEDAENKTLVFTGLFTALVTDSKVTAWLQGAPRRWTWLDRGLVSID